MSISAEFPQMHPTAAAGIRENEKVKTLVSPLTSADANEALAFTLLQQLNTTAETPKKAEKIAALQPKAKIETTAEEIDIAGVKLKKVSHYIINGGIETEQLPPAKELIEEALKQLAGKEIIYLLVEPLLVATLVAQGVITPEQLNNPDINSDKKTISIYGVEFSGKKYTLKTMPQQTFVETYGFEQVIPVLK